jgi:hypothetical protein
MKEEIGITIDPKDLQVAHVMQRKASQDERIDFFMTATAYSGEVTNCEPHKCDDLRWFALDALPENMVGYVRTALGHYLNGTLYSESGY